MLCVTIVLIVSYPCKSMIECCRKRHNSISKGIYWNFWLRFALETCLEVGFALAIFIINYDLFKKMGIDPTFMLVNQVLAHLVAAIFLFLPIFFGVFLWQNFKNLN